MLPRSREGMSVAPGRVVLGAAAIRPRVRRKEIPLAMSQSRLAFILLLTQVACSSSVSSEVAPGPSIDGSASHDGESGTVGEDADVAVTADSSPASCASGDCTADAQTPSDDAGANPGDAGPVVPPDGSVSADAEVEAGNGGGGDAAALSDADGPDSAGGMPDATIHDSGPDAPPGDSATPTDAALPDASCPPGGCVAQDAGATLDAGVDSATASVSIALLTANQAGRSGADLLLTVEASGGPQNPSFGLDIQLRDGAGNPVAAFTNWSGVPTYSERTVLFDNTPSSDPKHFLRTVTLRGIMATFPGIRGVSCALAAPHGESNKVGASVTTQALRTLHQSCDPSVITSRCTSNLACVGGACNQPTAPNLSQFSYLSTSFGGLMLLAGTDTGDDVSSIHFEFFGKTGQPIGVDLTGSGDLQTSFDQPASGVSRLGQFFFSNQSSPGFDSTVVQLAATPYGAISGTGNRVMATLQSPPLADTGGTCDARGFGGCVSGDVCVNGTCVTRAAALDAAAQGASVLDPTSASILGTGYAQGVNLWGDPPQGCAPAGVREFPQGIALVHLDADAPTLTITTNNEETTVSAALFVLAGVGSSVGGAPLGCNSGLPAAVSLTNVAAGDYTIVVTSTSPAGGAFGVSISK